MNSSGQRAARAVAALLTLALLTPSAVLAEPEATGTPEAAPAAPPAEEAAAGSESLEGGEFGEPSEAADLAAKVFDVFPLRVLAACAIPVGFAFFVISVPLVAASGGIRNSWEFFVLGPVDYTIVRPLGDF